MHNAETKQIPLTDLAVGQSGELAATPETDTPQRLRELGFVSGTRVTLVRRGALGDPIEIELRGYRMCLRRRDLVGMRVVLGDVEA